MKVDVYHEIDFKTARSGGKGGQHVNKVETMVEGRWLVAGSMLVSEAQKQVISGKLANKITADGYLLVKSQSARTQLENKAEVVRKMNDLVNMALEKKKARIETKPSKASREKRIYSKKLKADIKSGRRKVQY